jgi:hypothetical protein
MLSTLSAFFLQVLGGLIIRLIALLFAFIGVVTINHPIGAAYTIFGLLLFLAASTCNDVWASNIPPYAAHKSWYLRALKKTGTYAD